jgi:hypothetical protein
MTKSPKTKAWRSAVYQAATAKDVSLMGVHDEVHIGSIASIVQYLMTAGGGPQTIRLRIDALIYNAVQLDDYEHYECHGDAGLLAANRLADLMYKSYYGVHYDDLKNALEQICKEIACQAAVCGLSYSEYVIGKMKEANHD